MAAIRAFLQCLLKLVNFFLIVVGLLTVVYAAWMLTVWYKQGPVTLAHTIELLQGISFELPASCWGVVLLVGLNGACAAETASPSCLGLYQFGLVLLLVTEGFSAAAIYFFRLWDKDLLPEDPSGQSKRVKDFIAENEPFCKWGFVGLLVVQIFALFLASLITWLAPRPPPPPPLPRHATPQPTPRAVVASKAKKSKKAGVNEPLLPATYVATSQPSTSSSTSANPVVPAGPVEPQPPRTDAWHTRMQEKYGVDTSKLANTPDRVERRRQQEGGEEEKKGGGCSMM